MEVYPKIAVQIAVYWTPEGAVDIAKCFESLEKINYPRDRWCLVLVDNPSEFGNARELIQTEVLPKVGESLPEVIFVGMDENTGFSGGHNIAYEKAVDWGAEYVYLFNQDAVIRKDGLRRVAEYAVLHPEYGAVQSRMMRMGTDRLNSCGNCLHYLGFGFSDGNGEVISVAYSRNRPHFYASGGAVLVSVNAVKKAGCLFYSDFFMYHEDVDLSWRLRLAGYDIGYCHESSVQHRYEFSRSITKFYWMERNRLFTHFVNLRVMSLILIVPVLFVMEVGSLYFSYRNGWMKKKIEAYKFFFKASTWKTIFERRKVVAGLRVIGDRAIVREMIGVIASQEVESPLLKVVNPVFNIYFWVLKIVIFW